MNDNGSYGRELPLRAQQLLTGLEHNAREILGNEPSSGSLFPTFLLTMAMPIIIQPYERFFGGGNKHLSKIVSDYDGYSQGSKLANGLKDLKSREVLEGTPMDGVEWRFAALKACSEYTLTKGMTTELRSYLEAGKAIQKARQKSPKNILEHLRHAMAHGTIMYLDSDWRPSLFGGVEYFLFANARTNGTVDFLRISVLDFHSFLMKWAQCLHDWEYTESH